ncbi:xenotropic and polytropic retrovirus receptor 1-like [Actinia tenebrosa]|uniref:Xenotropic and polytropic retrovirus receptor 1-like n=1 Tax=Actinia tenebrosa TaxID=6105 RepID=A0A6P8I7Q8_ACTTE|nr:xenotropic and polytropic retrovirus receptor 1-like [Actinia tenebrosa]
MHFNATLTVIHALDDRKEKRLYLRYSKEDKKKKTKVKEEIHERYNEKNPVKQVKPEKDGHRSKKEHSFYQIFRLGLFVGMCIVLFTVMIVAAITSERDIQWEPAFRMYRGLFMFILSFFLFGMNICGWKAAGINHAKIIELDHGHLSAIQILEKATFFAVVWGISVVLFIFSHQFGVSRYFHPLALTCFLIIFFANTLKVSHRSARFWLIRTLWRVLTTPFHPVGFADFWLADQLNSLVVAILDMEYIACYYALDFYSVQDRARCGSKLYGIRPLVACLPAWWRFSQSLRRYNDTKQKFPHLANAGKYSTTFFVVFFSTIVTTRKEETGSTQLDFYFFGWVVSAFVSTCYTFTWDIKMDWGLLQREDNLLRTRRMFKHKSFYYFGMVSDLVLRFSWILTLSVGEAGLFNSEVLVGFLAVVELFRRFIWNFFRVENEHIHRTKCVVIDHNIEELQEYEEEEEETGSQN